MRTKYESYLALFYVVRGGDRSRTYFGEYIGDRGRVRRAHEVRVVPIGVMDRIEG